MGRSMFRAFGQMVPGPGKANGGEGAFFISGDYRTLGLADGVGGWSSMGVDPGKYARLVRARHCLLSAIELCSNAMLRLLG